MVRKQMEGKAEEKRRSAATARSKGKKASEVGATTGASKQRTTAKRGMTHQQKLDLRSEGKQRPMSRKASTARPGSRDADSPDREIFPRH